MKRKYTRVEVIAEDGNEYSSWAEHTVEEQDGGKTLKIFKTLPEKRTKPGMTEWNKTMRGFERHE